MVLTVPSLAPAFGGPAVKAERLAAALRARGHEVAVYAGAGAATAGATILPSAVAFRGTPVPHALGPVVQAAAAADVVHVIGVRDPVGLAAAVGARRGGTPLLLEPAGMLRPRLRSIALKRAWDATVGRVLTGAATALIATSRLEAQEFVADGWAPARVRVRPNGVDLRLGPPPVGGGMRAAHGIPRDAPLVVSIGRLARKKGLVALVEAVAAIPGAHLYLAGPDAGDGTLAAVRRRCVALAVTDRVHLAVGGVWGAARDAVLADADVFCLYSRHENFGSAAAEAAAAGVATVVSDACGVADVLGAGCCVVPAAAPAALRAAVAHLCDSAPARARLAADGERATAALAWPAVAEAQAQLYAEVCR